MFSPSTNRIPARRRAGQTESFAGSVRTSRASTPSVIGGRRRPTRYDDRASIADDDSMDGSIKNIEQSHRRAKGDVDEGTVFSQDDMQSISLFSKMPSEVTNALQLASPYDPIQANLDPVTGYAQLVTRTQCFVWSYAMTAYDTPTCFSFKPPEVSSSSSSIPSHLLSLCSLVPRGDAREPGLLLVSPNGLVRYSDNISSAFVIHRQQETNVALGAGEVLTHLERLSPSMFVASTSHARMFSLRLVSIGGQVQPQATLFAQPKGIFGRLFGTAANLVSSNAGIVALKSRSRVQQEGHYEIFSLSKSTVQKWTFVEGRGERLLFDEEVRPLLIARDERISPDTVSSDSVHVVDASLIKDGTLLLLYAFTSRDRGPLHYGLASFSVQDSSLELHSLKTISYSNTVDARPYSQARLVVPFGGPLILIVLSEAIVQRLLDKRAFEEVIELREAARNRIIGVGYEGTEFEAPADLSRATVVTQSCGSLMLEMKMSAIRDLAELIESSKDRALVDTHRLKQRLERGVLHSDALHNPISFDLPLELRGDLIAAAEHLSDDILQSALPSLNTALDMRIQLATRLEKLHSLAVFLASNGRLGMLSQNARRKLCADAQLVAAAVDLWEYQNEVLRSSRNTKDDRLLAKAIEEQADVSRVGGDDVLRNFFRYNLRQLGSVLQSLRLMVEQASTQGVPARSAAIYEGNRILLTTFQAAARYKKETTDLYRLDDSQISREVWTDTADCVHLLQSQASLTYNLIQERHRQLGSSIDMEQREIFAGEVDELTAQQQLQQALKGQLCELVGQSLDCYGERLGYLRNASNLESEHELLEKDYVHQRKSLLLPLADIGRLDKAFSLAERHYAFATLTQLCTSLPDTQQKQRLHFYLHKYGEPFSQALFSFYVEHGQMQTLLAQDEEFSGLLQSYLNAHPALNRVAWLHNLAIHRSDEASANLLREAGEEKDSTASKKLMLSIAKLSHVSQLTEAEIATQKEQARVELIDDQLDILSVQERIRQSIDHEAPETTVSALGEERPALKDLFLLLTQELEKQRPLLSEDLLDLLTLHDANESSLSDFALALEVFVRACDMPQARAECALAALWRRVVLFDDWTSITQTSDVADEEMTERLQSTALYQTLLAAMSNSSTADNVMPLSRCTLVPTVEVLQARLTQSGELGDSEQSLLGRLLQDFQVEVFALQEALTTGKLATWYAEIERLAYDALQHPASEMDTQNIDEEDGVLVE